MWDTQSHEATIGWFQSQNAEERAMQLTSHPGSNGLNPFLLSEMAYNSEYNGDITYPPVNKLVDPENHQFLMETSLPTPICQGLC